MAHVGTKYTRHQDHHATGCSVVHRLGRPRPQTCLISFYFNNSPDWAYDRPTETGKKQSMRRSSPAVKIYGLIKASLVDLLLSSDKPQDDYDLSDILNDPTRLFNGDETGFALCPKTKNVLSPKGYKDVYELAIGNPKENLT
ncbi:hypothetical protein ACI65C_003264 [Semiaphis heraclei]